MTFSLRGDSIPTDGSGHVFISISNEDALICHSERSFFGNAGVGDWYLHPTEMSTGKENRIVSPPPRGGWSRNRAINSEGHRLVRLRRDSDTAEEGVFTCHIPGNDKLNTSRALNIYYLSE